ncbi:hypothetical protein [Anoxynatronum sibiricum]|uniref:Uncharacterized protein n=1 Tax=Anoxynatronum sibiricum TaxID=210623 RepID=A0ABU9VV58_9CLOT
MKIKKVILFIVEGIADKTSLGGIIGKLVSSNLIKFYITGGDVTSDQYTHGANAVKKVNEHVNRFLKREIGINKGDIIRIVHLIDMDGAYIESAQIKVEEVEGFVYSESFIAAKAASRVTDRNSRKQQVVNRLSLCPQIAGIPYNMYYFSCNLEHVLHNEINLADELKMEYAAAFSDSYHQLFKR